jgi:RNA polymerase sigma factor (sigma-70 family)
VEASELRHRVDIELARSAASGSVAAWHEFILSYSALILVVVRRYLRGFDVDEHRAVYVEILEQFHRVRLSGYDGSVPLSSWVMLVARSRCLDALRLRFGRKRFPAWLERLSRLDREVYRLHFVEANDIAATTAKLRRIGHDVDTTAVVAALDRLDSRIDHRLRTQLAYELQARSVGGTTARLLEFLDDSSRRTAEAQDRLQPDAILIEQEALEMLARIRAHVDRLPADEKRAVELYYWDGLRAEEVAARMGLAGRTHGLIRRAVARLRRIVAMESRGDGRGPRPSKVRPCSLGS